jgi:fringe protein
MKIQENFSFSSSIIDQTIILIRTSHYCQSRLDYLRQSWIPTKQSNIYFLTDNLSKYSNKTILNSFKNFIETNCPETHNAFDLCCKTSHEFELFHNLSQRNSNLHWLCRFDDDQYINLNNLYKFLSQIDSSKPYYIGRTSIDSGLEIPRHSRRYRFATYGAGVCFTRPLLDKLRPYVNKTIFPYNCKNRGISDDAYIGYLIEFILNISLISLKELFHSHLEHLDISFRLFNIDHL